MNASDQVTQGLGRLILQYSAKTRIRAYLASFLTQVQDVEDVLLQILSIIQDLGSQVGAQLDLIGRLVGQKRNGLSDADYLSWIRAKILVNRSAGRPDDVLRVLALTVSNARTNLEFFPAAYLIELAGALTIDPVPLAALLGQVRGVGINGQLLYSLTDDADTFTFADADAEQASTAQGWADDSGFGVVTVGNGPSALAFDGANLWCVNNGDETVNKIRVSDGTVLGSYSVGGNPVDIAYDAANSCVWVVNSSSHNVTKLNVADGSVAGTYNVGVGPLGIAVSTTHAFVENYSGHTVTKLLLADGSLIATYTPAGVCTSVHGILFDGTNIWIADTNHSTLIEMSVTGSMLNTYSLPSKPGGGIAFDGTNIWITCSGGLVKVVAATGVVVGTYAAGINPYSLAVLGQLLFVADYDGALVTAVVLATGATLATFAVGTNPIYLAADGANVWCANAGSNNVQAIIFGGLWADVEQL